MKTSADRYRGKLPTFKVGDKVWLDTTNLKLAQPMHKLGPKRVGPFKVLAQVGTVSYKLDLPQSYRAKRVHPTFYAGLLSPANLDNPHRDPAPLPPPPDIVEGEEHYEIEYILRSRRMGRGVQYLIKWKGYEDTTWESSNNLVNANDTLQDFFDKHPNAIRHRTAQQNFSLPWE